MWGGGHQHTWIQSVLRGYFNMKNCLKTNTEEELRILPNEFTVRTTILADRVLAANSS